MRFYNKERLFPYESFKVTQKKVSLCVPLHVHDFFEIEYIIKGTGTYIIDGIEYPIKDNMLFFMSPASFHAVRDLNAEIINLMFPCGICDTTILFQLFFSQKNVVFTEDSYISIEKLLNRIVTCYSKDNKNHALNYLQCLLYELDSLVAFSDKTFPSYVKSTIIYIAENFRKNITLESVAKHVGLTPTYLGRIFHEETGINFKTYLDNLRFTHATQLLNFTDIDITDVCEKSGFTDYANFSRRFKQKFKVTPTFYRKLYQNDLEPKNLYT